MKPGRPSAEQMLQRDSLETAQAELIGLLRDLDEVILRNRQAVRRTPLVADVLGPGIERLTEIRESLRRVQENVNTAWSQGQERNWHGTEHTHPVDTAFVEPVVRLPQDQRRLP